MFLVGLILFAAAVAAAIIGIVQNRHLVIDVHALGQTGLCMPTGCWSPG